MRIQNISSLYYPKPTFNGSMRQYGKIEFDDCILDKYSTDTLIFREDLDWKNFVLFLQKHFINENKINVYSIASSDGSEGYTFIISVLENLPPNEQDKFLPVYASDNDKTIIRHAKKKRINLSGCELSNLKKHTSNEKKYFINPQPLIKIPNDNVTKLNAYSYEPIEKLKESITFEQADILTKIKSLNDKGNSVIMCRNVSPYLDPSYVKELVATLQTKLKRGSILVLGDFDRFSNIHTELIDTDFIRVMNNVYKKV